MRKYQSHKVVEAARIIDVEKTGPYGMSPGPERHYRLDTRDLRYVDRWVPQPAGTNYEAEVGDYYVVYPDGYKSLSPAAAFEAGYTELGSLDDVGLFPGGFEDDPEAGDWEPEVESRDSQKRLVVTVQTEDGEHGMQMTIPVD